MNNVTFGDENIGYYETVAGGAGAVSLLNILQCCNNIAGAVVTAAATCSYIHSRNFFVFNIMFRSLPLWLVSKVK